MKLRNVLVMLAVGAVALAVTAVAFARSKGISVSELAELGAGVVTARTSRHTIADRTAAILAKKPQLKGVAKSAGDLRVVEVEREVEAVIFLADTGLYHKRLGRLGRGEGHAVASARAVARIERHPAAEVGLTGAREVGGVPVHAETGAFGPWAPRGHGVQLRDVEGEVERGRVCRFAARHLNDGVFHARGVLFSAKIDLPTVALAAHQLHAAHCEAVQRHVGRHFAECYSGEN